MQQKLVVIRDTYAGFVAGFIFQIIIKMVARWLKIFGILVCILHLNLNCRVALTLINNAAARRIALTTSNSVHRVREFLQQHFIILV